MNYGPLYNQDKRSWNFTDNVPNHIYTLDFLAEKKVKKCKIKSHYDIYEELKHVTYSDFKKDTEHLFNIGCAVTELLKQHKHDVLSFVDISSVYVGTRELRAVLTPVGDNPLSQSTVEGVTWLVGFNGNPLAFAVVKHGTDVNDDTNIIHELLIGLALNSLRSKTPNFMYVYGGFACSLPELSDYKTMCSSDKNMNVMMLSEVINTKYTFRDLYASDISDKDLIGVVAQICITLSIAQSVYSYIHTDLHPGNILIEELPEPVLLKYKTGQGDAVISSRYIAKIIDYGFSCMTINAPDPTFIPPLKRNRGLRVSPQSVSIECEAYIWSGGFFPLYDVGRLLMGMYRVRSIIKKINPVKLERLEDFDNIFNGSLLSRKVVGSRDQMVLFTNCVFETYKKLPY
jgi:serine/threonine protein kinase